MSQHSPKEGRQADINSSKKHIRDVVYIDTGVLLTLHFPKHDASRAYDRIGARYL